MHGSGRASADSEKKSQPHPFVARWRKKADVGARKREEAYPRFIALVLQFSDPLRWVGKARILCVPTRYRDDRVNMQGRLEKKNNTCLCPFPLALFSARFKALSQFSTRSSGWIARRDSSRCAKQKNRGIHGHTDPFQLPSLRSHGTLEASRTESILRPTQGSLWHKRASGWREQERVTPQGSP